MLKDSLQSVLGVEQVDEATFRGNPTAGPFHRMFGGQLLAQAVCAAGQIVRPDRTVASVRGTFLREGDCSRPINYTARRLLQGRTFSILRVDAIQNDRLIFVAEVSLQTPESEPRPVAPAIFADLSEEILRSSPFEIPLSSDPAEAGNYRSHFDLRPAEIVHERSSALPIAHPPLESLATNHSQAVWFRLRGGPPETDLLTSAALAYASDFTVLQLVKKTKSVSRTEGGTNAATLNHSVWWHAAPKLTEWSLYFQEAPRAGGIRGVVFGRIYDSSGTLIASTAQEGIARIPPA